MASFISILFLILSILQCKAIEIYFVTYLYTPSTIYTDLTNKFNEYAIKNNLDITLKHILFNYRNSTSLVDDYGSSLEFLMNKKSDFYSIYMFDTTLAYKFRNRLLDLNTTDLKGPLIDNMLSEITSNICKIDNKVVCLPLSINFGVLYSNKMLLDKYHKDPPKTWDELLSTGKYILEEEKNNNNNTNIIGYVGHMPEYETSVCSSFEFLHSYRNEKDKASTSIPDYSSPNAVKAFNKLKEIKNELSSDIFFEMPDYEIVHTLYRNQILFARYWDNIISTNQYYVTYLPGGTEGMSSSCINTVNVGINKYLTQANETAALEVLKFLFSEDIQREILTEQKMNVAMEKLYREEDTCEKIEKNGFNLSCDEVLNMQYVLRPFSILKDYDRFSSRYRKSLSQFLRTNATAENTLKDMYNIGHIYYVEYNSFVGVFMMITNNLINITMVTSYFFIFKKNIKPYFKFLKNRYWLLFIFGLFTVNIYPYMGISKLNRFKCYIGPILVSLGFTLSFTPIVLKMIVNFPVENKISQFIDLHYFVFILIFVLIDIVTFIIYSTSPLIVKTYYIDKGLNFQRCVFFSSFGRTFIFILMVYKAFILVVISLFLFMEWNIEETREDIRSFTPILYVNVLSIALYVMMCTLDITNYYANYLFRVIPIYCYTITNYLMVIGLRFFYAYFRRNTEQDRLEKMLFKRATFNFTPNFTSNFKNISTSNNTTTNRFTLNNRSSPSNLNTLAVGNIEVSSYNKDSSSAKLETIKSKMMNFHFSKGRNSLILRDTSILMNIDDPSSFINEEFLMNNQNKD